MKNIMLVSIEQVLEKLGEEFGKRKMFQNAAV